VHLPWRLRQHVTGLQSNSDVRLEITAAQPIDALTQHSARRRNEGRTPLLADLAGLDWQPKEPTLALAAQLAQGLSAHR
jgi:hypothetical protein